MSVASEVHEPATKRRSAEVTIGNCPEPLSLITRAYGVSARTMTVEPLANAAYLYAKSPLANDELIARILPWERHAKGAAVMLGADLDHCPLFDAQGRAFEQKWRATLAAA